MKQYTRENINDLLPAKAEIAGKHDFLFTNAAPVTESHKDSISWISPTKNDRQDLLAQTKASVIICSINDREVFGAPTDKTIIYTDNPRLLFLRIVDHFFSVKRTPGIHPSASIHPSAKISSLAYVGPLVIIGENVVIGDHSILHGNIFIYDNVHIGSHVTIHAGTIIGADGFGYARNEDKEFEKFPHIGGVIIEDHVDIGANACIDRGTLGNTLIKTGAKIDNLVHIAHNVVVGMHAAVIANAMIGGSTIIGDYAWIAPSAAVRDGIEIGNDATIGLGAVVTKSVPDNETWTGSPARPLQQFLHIQKKILGL